MPPSMNTNISEEVSNPGPRAIPPAVSQAAANGTLSSVSSVPSLCSASTHVARLRRLLDVSPSSKKTVSSVPCFTGADGARANARKARLSPVVLVGARSQSRAISSGSEDLPQRFYGGSSERFEKRHKKYPDYAPARMASTPHALRFIGANAQIHTRRMQRYAEC